MVLRKLMESHCQMRTRLQAMAVVEAAAVVAMVAAAVEAFGGSLLSDGSDKVTMAEILWH